MCRMDAQRAVKRIPSSSPTSPRGSGCLILKDLQVARSPMGRLPVLVLKDLDPAIDSGCYFPAGTNSRPHVARQERQARVQATAAGFARAPSERRISSLGRNKVYPRDLLYCLDHQGLAKAWIAVLVNYLESISRKVQVLKHDCIRSTDQCRYSIWDKIPVYLGNWMSGLRCPQHSHWR